MEFSRVADRVKDVPHTSPNWGKKLYKHVVDTKPTRILELGFAHGVSLCYMAAALDELAEGHIIGIDLPESAQRRPSAEELLSDLGLGERVTLIRDPSGYNWAMKRMIDTGTVDGVCEPQFGLCFIDGAHDWNVDALAFYLVDKLLVSGGWLLFDDLDWTYESSPAIGHLSSHLQDDYRTDPHVRRVFELLVMQHPDYSEFQVDDRWGWAKKDALGSRTVAVQPVGAMRVAVRHVLKAVGLRQPRA